MVFRKVVSRLLVRLAAAILPPLLKALILRGPMKNLPTACVALLFSAAISASGATFLLDFGAAATPMDPGDDPTFTWNNVPESIGTSNTAQLSNLLTVQNETSDINLQMIARFNGSNTNGTLASLLYPSDATRDSLFGNTELFGTLSNVFPEFKLTSLDPSLKYDFTFYASRGGVGDNRETQYTVTGASSGIVFLNVANNVDNQVTLFGVTPDALGEINIRLTPGPNNNNSNHFTYLGVLKIVSVPEPSSALILIGGMTLLGLTRKRRA